MRRLAGLGAAVAVAFLATIASAMPAAAHNSLIASTPRDGAQVESGPNTIELTFDQPVQTGQGLNTVAVTGPNNDHWEAGQVTVASNVVTAAVRPLGPAGAYKIGYRILSADGHPVSGELTFTLTKDGTGKPRQVEVKDLVGRPDGDGLPIWVWIVGAVVLLGGGVFFALRGGGGAKA